MKIIVPIKHVPDLVEELLIDESGKALDDTWLRLIINEFDDHAIEQAILLKEQYGGEVVVVGLDAEDLDKSLFTAAAKGADLLLKLTGDFEQGTNNHAEAKAFAECIGQMSPDLVLVGVQAHDDLDGQIGTILAEHLGFPYVGYVAGVKVEDGKAIALKEYPGGLIAEMEVKLPAVLGIQASEKPPRYIAFSKVRQAMNTASIEEQTISELDIRGGPEVSRMFEQEAAERATLLEGDIDDIAAKVLEILKEQGVV